MKTRNLIPIVLLSCALVAPPAATAAQETTLAASYQAARAIEVGGSLNVIGVNLDGQRGDSVLELRRIAVFTPDARIIVDADQEGERVLQPPDNRYFVGHIKGEPYSRVMLDARHAGDLRGIITSGGEAWLIGNSAEDRSLRVRKVDVDLELEALDQKFECSTSDLHTAPKSVQLSAVTGPIGAPTTKAERAATPSYTARIAIDTDTEFLDLFSDNTAAATDYVADIIAFESGIYSAEIDTSLMVQTLYLYTTSDPWTQFSTGCLLAEFGKYWNDNRTGIDRTIAHFMSGKNNGGGIAWVGVLCGDAFNYPGNALCGNYTSDSLNYGGDYGYTGTMNGDFDINNPTVLWDIVATAHEIGHNFNSPHTHCYAGIGGNASPVDECYSGEGGCFSGGPNLPGPSGAGSGTIMSYCHLLSPGMSNVSYTFGEGHPYGVAPERVGARMNDHVVASAGANPGCLDYVPNVDSLIFSDDFENNNTNAWSNTAP